MPSSQVRENLLPVPRSTGREPPERAGVTVRREQLLDQQAARGVVPLHLGTERLQSAPRDGHRQGLRGVRKFRDLRPARGSGPDDRTVRPKQTYGRRGDGVLWLVGDINMRW